MKTTEKWKRLTEDLYESMNCLNNIVPDSIELEYLVLPEGNWTPVTRIDSRLRHHVHAVDPKIVYRYRPIDKATEEWNKLIDTAWYQTAEELFKLGFNLGREINK